MFYLTQIKIINHFHLQHLKIYYFCVFLKMNDKLIQLLYY